METTKVSIVIIPPVNKHPVCAELYLNENDTFAIDDEQTLVANVLAYLYWETEEAFDELFKNLFENTFKNANICQGDMGIFTEFAQKIMSSHSKFTVYLFENENVGVYGKHYNHYHFSLDTTELLDNYIRE